MDREKPAPTLDSSSCAIRRCANRRRLALIGWASRGPQLEVEDLKNETAEAERWQSTEAWQ
jgi:hypothetical protein